MHVKGTHSVARVGMADFVEEGEQIEREMIDVK